VDKNPESTEEETLWVFLLIEREGMSSLQKEVHI
jgi:hypothetical protein